MLVLSLIHSNNKLINLDTKQINIKNRTYYFFNDMINYFICYFIHIYNDIILLYIYIYIMIYIYYNDLN